MAKEESFQIFASLSIWFLMLSCRVSDAALKCFSCGYLKDADGNIGPIVEVEFAIPFCNGSDSTYWPTETIEGVSKLSKENDVYIYHSYILIHSSDNVLNEF